LQLTSKAKGVESASWVEGVQVLDEMAEVQSQPSPSLLYEFRAGMLDRLTMEAGNSKELPISDGKCFRRETKAQDFMECNTASKGQNPFCRRQLERR
jgi:hypothetical protein